MQNYFELFFRIPSDAKIRQKWIASINSHQKFDHSVGYFIICDLHFKESDFFIVDNERNLKFDSVPTIFPSNW